MKQTNKQSRSGTKSFKLTEILSLVSFTTHSLKQVNLDVRTVRIIVGAFWALLGLPAPHETIVFMASHQRIAVLWLVLASVDTFRSLSWREKPYDCDGLLYVPAQASNSCGTLLTRISFLFHSPAHQMKIRIFLVSTCLVGENQMLQQCASGNARLSK
jgi:hypothetical protein